jgi:hypothetical protein
MSKKKPDQVVYTEEEGYIAHKLPYATNSSAPKIEATDLTSWKNDSIHKVNHQLKTKFERIKNSYNALVEQFEYNQLVYASQYSFEPIIGQTYHLYESKNKSTFLSILAPNECNFKHVGSFKLNEDRMWEKI